MDRKSVELFAGGGGLAMAVHGAGFRPLLVNEFAKRAVETLTVNGATLRDPSDTSVPGPGSVSGPRATGWPLVPGDVRDIPSFGFLASAGVDVLAGGPPCQPFSLGGVARGDEDERNMFPEMFRAIREMRPKAIVCENVRGLLRTGFRRYFEYIKREMSLPFVRRAEGATWEEHDAVLRDRLENGSVDPTERYHVVHVPVNAADYGVPQIRHRVILVAFRSDLGVDWARHQPVPEYSEAALIESMHDGTYWKRHDDAPGIDTTRERVMAELRPPGLMSDGLRPWRTLRDAIRGVDENEGVPLPPVPEEAVRARLVVDGVPDHVGWPGARIYTGHTPNELDRPAKTVKAGVHGVPGGESVMRLDDPTFDGAGHRYMTVRETARVMTFPDDWELAGPRGEKMRQLGNAVPVRLGRVFADAVRNALDEAGA
ncbi:DNA cytosine methyltransferase [Nocardiopsis sp. B62]|uniref:DNA cytosine methyltransferase n=1 Tax=Nocardiopsis sp. B62 TaxID=2824874 RepID=UPI001B382692|nr:DNA cytosine methyltransferase [Nocardiopsis sp. B62]MBQ1081050.1 DNA cytosine methyltransferase [Nocardiopsis sp. B62]